jgi:hypothetical protein
LCLRNNGILKEVEIAEIKDEINENVRRKQSSVSALAFAKFLSKISSL